MENMIILNSGQKIDVVFQDHVTLDIDCTLRYIKSGEAEINSYVVNTAQPQLDQVISSAQINMAAAIAKGIEDASLAAESAAASAIDNSIEHAETAVSDYVAANITPMLEHHVATSANSASSAATSANSADASATNAALSADAAGASATASLNSANAASASEARINNVISNAADEIFAQLSNPFSLLDYKFSEYELSNTSWLLSNGQWNSGAVYQSVYELLLSIYNGTTTKAGVSVKLSSETYADTDFVINTTDTTFRLPIKVLMAGSKRVAGNGMTLGLTDGTNNYGEYFSGSSTGITLYSDKYGVTLPSTTGSGSQPANGSNLGITTDETKSGIETSSTGLYLYFYVGEVVQDANIIAAAGVLNDMTNIKNASNFSQTGLSTLSGLGMPSDNYIDLTVGASGSFYTAPANGYVSMYVRTNGSGAITLDNVDIQTNIGSVVWTPSSQGLSAYVPVRKGQTVRIGYINIAQFLSFKFIYAEGEI